MAELVVLTCASGKQCGHTIPHLAKDKRFRLRLVVNSDSSLERLQKDYPSAEVVKADLLYPDACQRVLEGASSVYHVGPPLHPFETQIGFNMIDAASQEQAKPNSNFKHFVMSSVLWSQLNKMLHHEHKRNIEEYLIESPLHWTILSPTHFIDIIPVPMLASQEKPVFPMLWNPETEMSFITLSDIGEVGAKVITEREKHFFAQYQIVSTPPVTYTEVLTELGRQLGRDVEIKRLPYEEAVETFIKRSYGDSAHRVTAEAAERMLLHYQRHGLVGNTNVLHWLLGREPTSYQSWIQSKIKEASEASDK